MAKESTFYILAKIVLFFALLPFVLIWLVWDKTDWKRQNKWIATASIAVVFLFFLAVSIQNDRTEKIAVSIEPKIEEQQSQIKIEKQKDTPVEGVIELPSETFKVSHVVDGDTIKLANDKIVRYIGIDSPEVLSANWKTSCLAREASKKNKELLEGKEVKMVKDISETDKYGRLLRYVWVGDIFVNDFLVRNGLANADNFPPDEKFKDQLKEAENEAKVNKRGLWSPDDCREPEAISAPVPTPTSAAYSCNCKKTCAQMSCAEAQYQLKSCGCSARDADHDGVACNGGCQ